jgi:uncharacterized membrane protein
MSPNHHDRHWWDHPAVPTGSDLPFGDRAADWLRNGMGSWAFIFSFLGFMGLWMAWNAIAVFGLGFDPFPYILLNLMLSTLAGLQGGIILIASKRQDAVNAKLAEHDRETVKALVAINEAQTHLLKDMHARLGIGGDDAPRQPDVG